MANRVEPPSEDWVPKTRLGMMVKQGLIFSYSDILKNNYVVKEPEIVKALVPNLEYEVLEVRLVQKMT
ncbi:TPA: 30S ribosomal protein S5, partial [Candidatus Geothermarchaeota archaeon]|nr:30S ribosomal protein S5 [Candidatus Geothermarchaeota archaeon]